MREMSHENVTMFHRRMRRSSQPVHPDSVLSEGKPTGEESMVHFFGGGGGTDTIILDF